MSDKEMVKTQAIGLKPRTTFAGEQSRTYSTDYEALNAKPGSFTNVKKTKRAKNAQE